MIQIDCTELTVNEKLALASKLSDELEGNALALVKGESIVLDQLSKEGLVRVDAVVPIVRNFISRRKDGDYYSLEVEKETILVHSADPIASSRNKAENSLPSNLRQCPYCAFITEYEEEYVVHTRSHLFGF